MNEIKTYIKWGWGMLSVSGLCFFIITYFFSCHGKKIPIETPASQPLFVEEHSTKLENFVFLIKESHSFCIPDDEQSCIDEGMIVPVASASGVVLSASSSNIFILTANHFCESSNMEKMMGEIKIKGFIGESARYLNIVTYTQQEDICLLEGLRFKDEVITNTHVAKEMPKIGEKVINVAAPDSMASPNTRLMFDGIFAGCEGLTCVYTIPATFGSSGSGVYNEKGELISLLVAAARDFEHVAMGPHIDAINIFIETVEAEIDIY